MPAAEEQGSLEFFVDDSAIQEALGIIGNSLPEVMDNVATRTSSIAKGVLTDIFIETMDRLSYDAFAPEFRDAIIRNVEALPVEVSATATGGSAFIDFTVLGDRADLERAFHRNAVLRGGHRLTEPYNGQELAVEDADIRHLFFEAMLRGEPFQAYDGNIIQTAGLWDKTKQEYLEIWGDKSPQWLYLQYGQSQFEPKIPPGNILESFQEQMGELVTSVFQEEVEAAVAFANTAQSGITGVAGRYQSPAGGITIRGQFYPGGQFVGPKANI